MKKETPLTLFPAKPSAPPMGDPEAKDAGSSIWHRPMPAVSQASQRQARAQPHGREPKPHDGQGVGGSPDPLLTVDEFADQLRVSRACVRKWILERKVAVVKVGRLVRLRSSELHRIIDEGSRPRAQPH